MEQNNELKQLIEQTIKDGFPYAYSGDDTPLDEAIKGGKVAETYQDAQALVTDDLEGYNAGSKYKGLSYDEKIKKYETASSHPYTWEQEHTWIWDLNEELEDRFK